ncbi:MAG: Crp/Fnr family transcriptional regulator [Chloroflexi bacterium]|nr:Crp/Fnr family transcriptional regulator [Chloroflexota bacterium]MCC6895999.1 Crp/Fnr family transcriptional regulator [Anaerolineae bacterium]
MPALTRESLPEYLRSWVYFESLSDEHLHWLAAQCQRCTFAVNQAIFLEGDPARGMWMIEEGRVKIYKVNPEGEEHILHLLGAGNTFNEVAALDGGNNPAHAGTLTDAVVWLLPTEALNHLLKLDADLARKIIKLLAARVRRLVGQLEDLALYSVTIRLARFLLKQLDDPALSGPGVTRANIAAHLATQPETISRALRSLEQAQAIRFDRHRIVIEDEKLLRTLAAL